MFRRLGLVALIVTSLASRSSAILVSSAISLKQPLTEIAQEFEKETGERVEFELGASGQIVTRIIQGANVDVFISAAEKQVEDLEAAGLSGSARRIVAGNQLVLIAPAGKAFLTTFEDLADARIHKLAIGAPATVPAGQYAMQTLAAMKLDGRVSDRLVHGSNVRQVLDYVIRGEVDAGIVYRSDALAGGSAVRIVQTAPEESHDPIRYVGVVVKRTSQPAISNRFLDEIASPRGQEILKRYGFSERPMPPVAIPPDLGATKTWPAVMLSLRIALYATIVAALVAIPLAFALARWRFFGRSLLDALLMVPLILPPTVVGYFILLILGSHGPLGKLGFIFTIPGAVVAAAAVALPMLYLPASAAFASVDRELEETAKMWGANVFQLFWHVSLPLARRGIANGLLLAFARALGEFGATVMVFGSGPRQTLPISIYNDYLSGDLQHAAPAVAALSAISISVMFIYNRWGLGRRE